MMRSVVYAVILCVSQKILLIVAMAVEGRFTLIVSEDASNTIRPTVSLCSAHFVGLIGALKDLKS